jgi:hypothetical protein
VRIARRSCRVGCVRDASARTRGETSPLQMNLTLNSFPASPA